MAVGHWSRALSSPAQHSRRTSRSPRSAANRTSAIHDYTSSRRCSSPAMLRRIRTHNIVSSRSGADNSRTPRDTRSRRPTTFLSDSHLNAERTCASKCHLCKRFHAAATMSGGRGRLSGHRRRINSQKFIFLNINNVYLPNDRAIVCGLRDCAFTVHTAMGKTKKKQRTKKQTN